MSLCEEIRQALEYGNVCEETERGARILTHCLYPSFDRVEVFVLRWGEGFKVSDGGGALSSIWLHGRDAPGVRRIIDRECNRYGLRPNKGVLELEVASSEWLQSAILSVANASAAIASAAVDKLSTSALHDLTERIHGELLKIIRPDLITKEFEFTGKSGTHWKADFAIFANDNVLVINAVTAHHVSINQKYTEFSDFPEERKAVGKFAVFDNPLKGNEIALIGQVAALVPIASLVRGASTALALPLAGPSSGSLTYPVLPKLL